MEFLPVLIALLAFGSCGVIIKKSIDKIDHGPTLTISYLTVSFFLICGAFLTGMNFTFSIDLLLIYLLEIIIGAVAIIALTKALGSGKASIISPAGKLSNLLVLFAGIIFFNEIISVPQVFGILLIISAIIILLLNNKLEFHYEKWMFYLGIAIISYAFYFTCIKLLIEPLGFYQATLLIEVGIAILVMGYYLFIGKKLFPKSYKNTGYAFLFGLCILVGATSYSLSVSLIGVGLTASIAAGTPIVAAISAFFLLNEKLNFHKYIAIAFVVLGLIVVTLF